MTRTLKPSQRTAIEQDLVASEELLTNPNMSSYITDKSALRRQVKQMKDTLDTQSPQPYETSTEKNAAVKRERQLREEFTQGIPSKEEMRRNRGGDGTVYKHMKWEKANKAKILEWREIIKRLESDSDDPDLTNYERFRPERPFGYDTTAQIAGHHAMSMQAKENWPDDLKGPTVKSN